jgi:hypothetical protein
MGPWLAKQAHMFAFLTCVTFGVIRHRVALLYKYPCLVPRWGILDKIFDLLCF